MANSRLSVSESNLALRRRGSTVMKTDPSTWTFLSNHGHVLICLAKQPNARLRDVAELVGITERAVQSIVSDLEAFGALTRIREGRRNRYEIHGTVALRHPIESPCTIHDLLALARAKRKARRKRAENVG